MGEYSDFDINESLKLYLSDPSTIPTTEAIPELLDCENDPDNFTPQLIGGILEQVNDAISENPEALARNTCFDSLQLLLK